MATAEEILRAADSVLVVDWPTKDVPETLARAGFTVFVRGGPEPEDYSTYVFNAGQVVVQPSGGVPDHVDLVYCYRPVQELPGIVLLAQALGASAIWSQSGLVNPEVRDPKGCWVSRDASRAAREIVESAGLMYVDEPYVADVVRQLEPGD